MTTKLNPAAVLPEGYRLAFRFFVWPARVNGRYWWGNVAMVQRLQRAANGYDSHWVSVGFWDELRAGQDWEELG